MSALRRHNTQLRGTGDRAMVFAHGFGCDQRMWRYVAPHFESEFVTVLFDHVGSGQSDLSAYSTDRHASLKGYAQDLVELAREVPLEGAVLVGHSCGAMIGLLASLEAPHLFESLVLVSASPRYVNDGRYKGGFSKQDVVATLRNMRSDYAGWSEAMAPVFMGNTARPQLAAELLASFRNTDPDIAAEFGAAIFTSDWRPALSQVQSDCLIVQSEHDPVVPVSVGRYLKSHLAHGQLETIATDGHFPHLSDPDRLVECIRHFVDSRPPRAPRRRRARSPFAQSAREVAQVRWSAATWSRREPPVTDEQGRAELEELLLKRVGELWTQLGRYDMYALSIETWLRRPLRPPVIEPPVNVRTRGAVIGALLRSAGISRSLILQFEELNDEVLTVLRRHEIAAKNCAVIPVFHPHLPQSFPVNAREWYEYDSASDQELLFFIDAVELDILSVASLYVRLADWATSLGQG